MTIHQFLTICDNLKRVPRTGWLLRGIPPSAAENVAAHSHTTAILAYLLAKQVKGDIDFTKLLLMALFHDLPEAEIGDIPISAQRADPSFREAKEQAENLAMERILKQLPETIRNSLLEYWEEYLQGDTLESRLVEAADRLATAVHAVELVNSGYPPHRFTLFIDHAETTLTELHLSIAQDLVADLRRTIASVRKPVEK